MFGRVKSSLSRVAGFRLWKSVREVEEWVEVEKGVKVKVIRPETPEEYHGRPPDRLTIYAFERRWTIEILRPLRGLLKKRP